MPRLLGWYNLHMICKHDKRQNGKCKTKRKRITETNDSERHHWESNAHLGVILFSYIKKGTIIQKTFGGVEEILSYMNIFSVIFSLFVYLIRILSNDKKGFCRNSRKFSDCQGYSFLKTLPSATKKAHFSKFARYIREKTLGVYLRKILKIKTGTYWEASRVNRKSIWRKAGYQSFIQIGVVQLVGASRSFWPVLFFLFAEVWLLKISSIVR